MSLDAIYRWNLCLIFGLATSPSFSLPATQSLSKLSWNFHEKQSGWLVDGVYKETLVLLDSAWEVQQLVRSSFDMLVFVFPSLALGVMSKIANPAFEVELPTLCFNFCPTDVHSVLLYSNLTADRLGKMRIFHPVIYDDYSLKPSQSYWPRFIDSVWQELRLLCCLPKTSHVHETNVVL